jgi:TolB-like protein/DNA-binding winged helix-turn-helix (wHTH) protein
VPLPVFEFGNFRLDSGRFELLRESRALKIERKPMELLLLLVEANGRLVTRTEIAKKLWDSEVFVDTEHGINTAIRKIRLALRDDPETPLFIQTVTGMGYRFIAPVTTQPAPAPEPAPIEESTATIAPPSTSTEPVLLPFPSSSQPARPPRRRRDIALAFVAALSLVFLMLTLGPHPLADRLLRRNPLPTITSVAVLPLDNLSGDPSQEYFADGMTDELITMLAKNSALRITSRTSVMQYKAAHRPLPEIARALGVDGILEGSVSRSSDRVHLTLQLIRADTDTHVWAESYERDSSDVALPEEAARAIAKRLNSEVAVAVPTRYVNPAAHDAYLRGHYLWTVGRNKESATYFRKAVELQPDYAAGWAGLAEYLSLEAMYTGQNPAQNLADAEVAARKAVELDDSLAHGHVVFGAALLFDHWNAAGALRELDRATELEPQYGQALHLKAKILCALNRFDEANEAQEQSTAANAFEHPGARAEIFNCTRQFKAAIQDGLLRLRDFPASADVLGELSAAYAWNGQLKEAGSMRLRQLAAEGVQELTKAADKAYAEGGYPAVIKAEIEFLENPVRIRDTSPVDLAELHAEIGQREEAVRLLNLAADEHSPNLPFRINSPDFDSLHNDPRFRAIAQRVGLPYEPPPSKN